MPVEPHDRAYLQAHLREEAARSERHGHEFALAIFEALPASDGLTMREKVERGLRMVCATVRAGDVVARVYEDTIAALLVETTAAGAKDALLRVRNRLAGHAGGWRISVFIFPHQRAEIEALPLLAAA